MPTIASVAVTLLVLLGAGCQREEPADTIRVFAAASTSSALTAIADDYEAATGRPITLNFGASSIMARQIERGAPADLFVSADPAWMDHLAERGVLRAETRRDLLTNTLVVIEPIDGSPAPADTIAALVTRAHRVTLADPDSVPAGRYAAQALRSLGCWDAVAACLVPARDVRAALHLVETGAVDAGVVYATDAAASGRVRVVMAIDPRHHDAIVYPVAATISADAGALDFLTHLEDANARVIWSRAGFGAP